MMAKSVDAGLLESLLSIARNYSLNIGYNDIGNHHISYGSGYHANLSVKVNSEDEITDIIITPISGNYTGGSKTGVKGVPEKASTRAENMDEPCLRAVER